MDPDTIKIWLQGINMVGTFALGVWLYLEKRSDKTNEKVEEIAEKVGSLDRDVIGLKAGIDGAPNHDHLAKVYEAIKAQGESSNKQIESLAATVNQLVGENRGQSDTLRLILNQITQKGMQ